MQPRNRSISSAIVFAFIAVLISAEAAHADYVNLFHRSRGLPPENWGGNNEQIVVYNAEFPDAIEFTCNQNTISLQFQVHYFVDTLFEPSSMDRTFFVRTGGAEDDGLGIDDRFNYQDVTISAPGSGAYYKDGVHFYFGPDGYMAISKEGNWLAGESNFDELGYFTLTRSFPHVCNDLGLGNLEFYGTAYVDDTNKDFEQSYDGDGVFHPSQNVNKSTTLTSDGLDDNWEWQHFGDPTKFGDSDDPDGDGLSNVEEQARGTNPVEANNDIGDQPDKLGYSDAVEIITVSGQVLTYLADLTSDGYEDIIWLYPGTVVWYKNIRGSIDHERRFIRNSGGSVIASDIDSDGDKDILLSNQIGQIAWYENYGNESFGPENVLSTAFDGSEMHQAVLIDGDGDGDDDILSFGNYQISKIENLGLGVFSQRETLNISSVGSIFSRFGFQAVTIDLDNDDDLDIMVSIYMYPGRLMWFENLGGWNFSAPQVIDTLDNSSVIYNAADFDSDGDSDIIYSTEKLVWHENLGDKAFGSPLVVDQTIAGNIEAARDLDSDGDLDLIANTSTSLIVYENIGNNRFETHSLSKLSDWANVFDIYTIDWDIDGDLDIIVSSPHGDDTILYLYENTIFSIPYVNAGLDQTVYESDSIVLHGLRDDKDGFIKRMFWQVDNDSIIINAPQSDTINLTAPSVGPDGTTLTFTLTVIDNDELTSSDEVQVTVLSRDADNDGMLDTWESANSLNPTRNDSADDYDADGLTNLEEFLQGLSANSADTDGDGMPDGYEVAKGLAPTINDASDDLDEDGLTNRVEFQQGWDPGIPAPQVSISASPISGQHPLAVEFGTLVSSGPATCILVFGDGQSASCEESSHVYTAPGSYKARLTASNDGGGVSSTVQIDVQNATPVVTSTSFTTRPDMPLSGVLTATDLNGDTFTFALSSGPWHGNLSLAQEGGFTYTPSAGFTGGDSFSIEIRDEHGAFYYQPISIGVRQNTPPVADAGPDQIVDELAQVTLNGSNSHDPDEGDGIVSYLWEQVGGEPIVELSDPTVDKPTFTAPDVDGDASLTFRLTVESAGGLTATDTVIVNATWLNIAPLANAGEDATVSEGALVVLDSLQSIDLDDGIASYNWVQIGEPSVDLADPQTAMPSFSAPDTLPGGLALTFELTVADMAGLQATDRVTITVGWENDPPVADAGANQEVIEGKTVTLSGAGSSDFEADLASYSWRQTAGPSVTLSRPSAMEPTFVAPPVGAEGAELVFELTVTDEHGLMHSDTCSVTVQDNGITDYAEDVVTFQDTVSGDNLGAKEAMGCSLVSLASVDPESISDQVNRPEELPYGLLDFSLKVSAPGDDAQVTIYLPDPAPEGYGWHKWDEASGWTDYSANATFSADRREVTLSYVDGGIGDADGQANGIIVDPSGLAKTAQPDQDTGSGGSGSGSGAGGGGGCLMSGKAQPGLEWLILLVMVAASRLALIKRRGII